MANNMVVSGNHPIFAYLCFWSETYRRKRGHWTEHVLKNKGSIMVPLTENIFLPVVFIYAVILLVPTSSQPCLPNHIPLIGNTVFSSHSKVSYGKVLIWRKCRSAIYAGTRSSRYLCSTLLLLSPGVWLLSGIFDLEPIKKTSVNDTLELSE